MLFFTLLLGLAQRREDEDILTPSVLYSNLFNIQTYDMGFSYYKDANRIVRTIQWTQASVMKQRTASFRDIIPSGTDSRQ